jgi:hypothetical protein
VVGYRILLEIEVIAHMTCSLNESHEYFVYSYFKYIEIYIFNAAILSNYSIISRASSLDSLMQENRKYEVRVDWKPLYSN